MAHFLQIYAMVQMTKKTLLKFHIPLTDEQFSQLQTQISPHESGANYGIDTCMRVLQFLSQTL